MKLTPKQLSRLRRDTADAGNRIALALELAEISQADLAREADFSPQYVNDIVRGRYPNITLDNARRFATFFGCAIEDLFPESLRAAV